MRKDWEILHLYNHYTWREYTQNIYEEYVNQYLPTSQPEKSIYTAVFTYFPVQFHTFTMNYNQVRKIL